MSGQKTRSWLQQWERLKRWYLRVKTVEKGEWCEKDFASEIDILYSFFLNCYHLKDWLTNSGVEPESIEKYIDEKPELKLCADIANVSKHLTLRKHRSGEERLADFTHLGVSIPVVREYVPESLRQKRSRDYHIVICAGGKVWDALELAHTCIVQWQKFIEKLIQDGKIAA